MPVVEKRDEQGAYYQWGESGTKYHFDESDPQSRSEAEEKARRQGRAAYARGYREPKRD